MSPGVAMVERMYGGLERERLIQLGALADLAGTEPEMCRLVVETVRVFRDQLLVSELLEECKQDATLLAGQGSIGDDRRLGIGHDRSDNGHPPEVA